MGKSVLTSGLAIGRTELLRSLRHYTCEHKAKDPIGCLSKRGVEGGSTREYSFKGRERTNVNQTRSVSKATLGKLMRDRVKRVWASPLA